MDSHINRADPEKPAEMNFERILCFVLGGVGLLIAAFAAITMRSLGAFFYFGFILGIPLFLALIGRPRRWFVSPSRLEREALLTVPWWKFWANPRSFVFGQAFFRPLTRVDYALLAAMLLVSIPVLYWTVPWLFPGLPSDWASVTITAVIAMLGAAYLWQRPEMSQLAGVSGLVVACVALYLWTLFIWQDHLHDHVMSSLIALDVAVWSSIRYVILLRLDE